MILWHAGIACLLVYVTLGRRRIDYRFIVLGGILPDLIDPLLSLAGIDDGGAGRSISHTLLAVIAIAVVVIVGVPGRERKLAWFGMPVGWLTHLVADGMWQAPKTFLWPAFGTGFASRPAEPYSLELITEPFGHLATWMGEVVGALILAWFVVAFTLTERDRLRLFLRDGYLRP